MTPSQRSKLTRSWKEVRHRAKNPRTPAAVGVFIRRGMDEAFKDIADGAEKFASAIRGISISGRLP